METFLKPQIGKSYEHVNFVIQFDTTRQNNNYQPLNSNGRLRSVKDDISPEINSSYSFKQLPKEVAIDRPTAWKTRELLAQKSKAVHFKQFQNNNYQPLNSNGRLRSVKDDISPEINSSYSFKQLPKEVAIDRPTAWKTRELLAQKSKAAHFKQFYQTSFEKQYNSLSINVDINTGRIQLMGATIACVENAFKGLSELLVTFSTRTVQLKPEEIALINSHPHIAEALQQAQQQSNFCFSHIIDNDDSVTVTAANLKQCLKYIDIVKSTLASCQLSCKSVPVERLRSRKFIQVLENTEKNTRTSEKNYKNDVICIRGLQKDDQQAESMVMNKLRKDATVAATKAEVEPLNSSLFRRKVNNR